MMYNYLIFDGQYFLTRNFKMLKSSYSKLRDVMDDKGNPVMKDNKPLKLKLSNLNWNDLFRSTFQSIVKFKRDIINGDRIIVVFDSAPYIKSQLVPHYKCNRYYLSDDDLVGLNCEEDPAKYYTLAEEVRMENIKRLTKEKIIENFPKMGINILIHRGYEGDDLAKLLSDRLNETGLKSLIISSDSDWRYLVNENVDYSNPKGNIVRLSDVKKELDRNEVSDISVYHYKSILDSLYGSHNDLYPTIDKTKNFTNIELFSKLLNNDYSALLDEELYKKQLESFNLWNYPDHQAVSDKIELLNSKPEFMNPEEFIEFCSNNNLRITQNYYNSFIKTLK